jgi:glutamine amidotransferase
MGWDIVEFKQHHPLLDGLSGLQRYYFVHSYYAVCEEQDNVLMTCDYGIDFTCSVVNDNVMGVQFHPEKSHDFGLGLLSNFVKICNHNNV